MHYGLIIAGGSGTRLWPMSRAALPKQLIPFIGGKSLLQLAAERFEGLIPPERRYVCAGHVHRDAILAALPELPGENYLGEPEGRDTLNALGLAAAVIAKRDPKAAIVVLTADHILHPLDTFQRLVQEALELVDSHRNTLVTFGIRPTHAATGYGYLEVCDVAAGPGQATSARADHTRTPRRVRRYQEKPDAATAQRYLEIGPECYLWNSGMFVWRAAALLDCIARYEPPTHAGLLRIAEAWDTPQRDAVLAEVYPALRKISVDYAVMERAAQDPTVQVMAIPAALDWLDVGSWPSFAATCTRDEHGNAISAGRTSLIDTRDTLIASSQREHLIATIGCEDLIIIHTPDATLVCRADRAEDIRKLHEMIRDKYGDQCV